MRTRLWSDTPQGLVRAVLCLVAAIFTSWQAPADGAGWPVEWSMGNLHFHADYDPGQDAARWKELRDLRTDIARDLGIQISDDPIHVILFAAKSDYERYLATYFPGVPSRRAMFIKRRGPGMVFAFANPEMEIDLRHEMTHALLNASLPYVPLWLDEGLAEYFERPREQRGERSQLGLANDLKTLFGRVPAIEDLEAVEDLAHMRPTHYRAAWSWVHFMLHESEQSRKVLHRFLADIQSGFPPGPLSRRVAAEIPGSSQRYLTHFR